MLYKGNKNMKQLLILTTNKFPEGDAGSVRQAVFGKLFLEMGYCVTIFGMGSSTQGQWRDYAGIRYCSFRREGKGTINKVLNYLFINRKLNHHLEIKKNKPDIILVIDLPIWCMYYVSRYEKRTGCMLLHDSVEWYSPEQFKNGKYSPSYIAKDLLNERLIRPPYRVIAISRFLQEHFLSQGLRVVRIPAILDVKNMPYWEFFEKDYIEIVYAGIPTNKDFLNVFLEGCACLSNEELSRTKIKLIGIERESLEKVCGVSKSIIEKIGNNIQIVGRMERAAVIKELETADFTFLVRNPNFRYAKAGFPTKVVESLAVGIPVICNLSSDLHEFLIDGANCIIIEEHDALGCMTAIRKALGMTRHQLRLMHQAARDSAERFFDFRCHIDSVKELIEKKPSKGISSI